jgi:hypothetical protein
MLIAPFYFCRDEYGTRKFKHCSMVCNSVPLIPDGLLSRSSSKEQLTQPAFTEQPPYLTESEKGSESNQNHQGPGEQFVPADAENFLKAGNQALPMNEAADEVLKYFKRQGKNAEEDNLIQGGNDQWPVIENPADLCILPQKNDLRQNERLERRKSVMEIGEAHLPHQDPPVSRKGTEKQGKKQKYGQKFIKFVKKSFF